MTKIFSNLFLTININYYYKFLDPSAKLFFLCARHCRVQHVSTELYLATYSRETCYFTCTCYVLLSSRFNAIRCGN